MEKGNDIFSSRFAKEDAYRAIGMPVYNNVSFEFASAEEMEVAFKGQSDDHAYSRISNPTVAFFEQRVKTLSGAQNVTALASGMAAIANTMFCIARQGMNIVSSPKLFGNTYRFFTHTLREFGVETRFCNMLDVQDVERRIDENTCAVFTELIANPSLEVVDLKRLAALTKRTKTPFIVDTTLIPWSIASAGAGDWGVDIEVLSSTKYISGGATSVGGLIVDHGVYDWKNSPKLKELGEQYGSNAFHVKLRSDVFRNVGACMSPQTAFLQNVGLETLGLRSVSMAKSCNELASFLESLPEVAEVLFPGLESSPFYAISRAQFGDYPGALLSFTMKEAAACFRFINELQVIRRATNLFDNKSLIIHPASTIYHSFSDEEKAEVGVPDNLIRLSVGLEDVGLLKEDIRNALSKACR